MSVFGFLFMLVNAVALLAVPRRWAPLPLLVGACYMTLGQQTMIGPFHFTVIRILVAAGFVRVLVRGERIDGKLIGVDKLLLLWGAWALLSSIFHKSPSEQLIGQMGLVYNTLGVYFLMRVFCQSLEDGVHLIKITAYLLAPVALEMVLEHVTGKNAFAMLGGVPEMVVERGERFRAQGPFAHPILAGTVGAACLPMMIGIWRKSPRSAKLGLLSCLLMIIASNSSGPIMSLISGMFALAIWRWRRFTAQMRVAAVVGYLLLQLFMAAPPYFLIARIDLTGSSTGWHRAELIRSSIEHLSEWWFAGTDYTRDWMPYGVSWSKDHVDITNHYLQYGVVGGLPLTILFIAALSFGFIYVGRCLDRARPESQFLIWALGSALFAQAASMLSVSYFDQSFLFLYLNLAIVVSIWGSLLQLRSPVVEAAAMDELEGKPQTRREACAP